MPSGFTESFAKRLDKLLPHAVREASDSAPVVPREILIGKGGAHLVVTGRHPNV
jgi:chemotaxis response regulator CheB